MPYSIILNHIFYKKGLNRQQFQQKVLLPAYICDYSHLLSIDLPSYHLVASHCVVSCKLSEFSPPQCDTTLNFGLGSHSLPQFLATVTEILHLLLRAGILPPLGILHIACDNSCRLAGFIEKSDRMQYH